ncbi:MAG: hypothetical protein H0W68_07865 [Gemmatimonadaceae bacterium]|nr:hypothetical protein [Gemmatimonadaceae bacterium]
MRRGARRAPEAQYAAHGIHGVFRHVADAVHVESQRPDTRLQCGARALDRDDVIRV